MTSKLIPVREVIGSWLQEPIFRREFDRLDEPFMVADALIRARTQANLTQEQVALRMGTTQSVVARLESGRSMPSTRTLQRFAEATGTRLVLSFGPLAKQPG